eukprot:365776-Chlamydomonas_euryale.AAC.12
MSVTFHQTAPKSALGVAKIVSRPPTAVQKISKAGINEGAVPQRLAHVAQKRNVFRADRLTRDEWQVPLSCRLATSLLTSTLTVADLASSLSNVASMVRREPVQCAIPPDTMGIACMHGGDGRTGPAKTPESRKRRSSTDGHDDAAGPSPVDAKACRADTDISPGSTVKMAPPRSKPMPLAAAGAPNRTDDVADVSAVQDMPNMLDQ